MSAHLPSSTATRERTKEKKKVEVEKMKGIYHNVVIADMQIIRLEQR